MYSSLKVSGSILAAFTFLLVQTSPVQAAYGPEGLFGGRPKPDSSIVVANPVELKNDRPERAESVLDHPRPDYDPVPIEVGSFELFPALELGETYADNIYATTSDKRNDAIGVIRPVINLFSNWGRHALAITTFGDFAHYSQHPDENYQSIVLDVNGRYDIMNQMWIGVRAGHQYLAEARTSPDGTGGTEPVTFNMPRGGLSFYRGVGRLKLTLDYDFSRFIYEDTPTSTTPIDQSDRSRDVHVAAATLKYDLSGNVAPYVRGSYNIRDYEKNHDHDADGYSAVVGTTMDLGGITSLDLFAGWMVENYNDFGVAQQLSTPKFGGSLMWNATGLTTVVFEMDRTIEETNLTGYNSYYQTGGSATVTHELLRNVILETDLAFSRADFNGTGDRKDDILTIGAGGRYLINRNLYTDLMYSWERRYSDVPSSNYIRNMVLLRLGVRL
ncbi:MAG TPA: hypothetical protein DD400_00410 [Rhodospirillaceae bacterium]|nr:hypothetical protein [Rhodospirillaceae bacterium]